MGITEYLKCDDCIFGHFNSMIMEKEVATHSSIPARIVEWTEEPGGLQCMRSQRVRHNLATEQHHREHDGKIQRQERTDTTKICQKFKKNGNVYTSVIMIGQREIKDPSRCKLLGYLGSSHVKWFLFGKKVHCL